MPVLGNGGALTTFNSLQASVRNASCVRAFWDRLGLPKPRHRTAGGRAGQKACHEFTSISTKIQKRNKKRVSGKGWGEWNLSGEPEYGREHSANHSLCLMCSCNGDNSDEMDSVRVGRFFCFFRDLTGVKSEYGKDASAIGQRCGSGISPGWSLRLFWSLIRLVTNRFFQTPQGFVYCFSKSVS